MALTTLSRGAVRLLLVPIEPLTVLLQFRGVLAQLGAVLVVIGLVEGPPVERKVVVLVLQLVGALLQAVMFVALGFCSHASILLS